MVTPPFHYFTASCGVPLNVSSTWCNSSLILSPHLFPFLFSLDPFLPFLPFLPSPPLLCSLSPPLPSLRATTHRAPSWKQSQTEKLQATPRLSSIGQWASLHITLLTLHSTHTDCMPTIITLHLHHQYSHMLHRYSRCTSTSSASAVTAVRVLFSLPLSLLRRTRPHP